jgi:hypothetical protein
MANPFKQAELAKKKAPGSKQEPVVESKEGPVVETPAEPEKPVEKPVEPVVEIKEVKETKPAAKKAEKKAEAPAKKSLDIFAGLEEPEKGTWNTYAFYLNDENAKKLKAMAVKKGVSTSKLLDYILSEVL